MSLIVVDNNAFQDYCLLVSDKFNIGKTNIEVP